MSQKRISILLPTYNGAQYVEQAIDSIRAQDYDNWELIVVDDCSTDTTPQLLAQIQSKDDRITVVRNEVNKKLPASINVAFEHSTGDYVTWTSDDNYFAPNALSLMASVLDTKPDVDLVYCSVNFIDQDGSVLSIPSSVGSARLLYFYNTIQACFLYRREVQESLGGYDESLFLVEDYDFWLRANRAHTFKHLKGVKPYYYRTHPNSLTSTRQHDIRVKACEILSREAKSSELSLGKRMLAACGYVYNSIRARTTKR